MKTTIKGNAFAKIDVGKVRMTNEDQAISLTSPQGYRLLCVCDGMGGHQKGDYASKLAADILCEEFEKIGKFLSVIFVRHWVFRTIKAINSAIYNEAQKSEIYHNMGTTLVLAFFYKDKIVTANIGDSRIYIVENDQIKKMTEDQTYVDYMVRTGKMTEEEAKVSEKRHVLLNAIGIFPSVSMDLRTIQNEKKPVLLCSDGLYNNASEREIHAVLRTKETPSQKVESLIKIANTNGGSDNIGIAYWEAM